MISPLYIRRRGCIYFDASDTDQQPDLREQVQAACRQRYRRIDRYTQLALLGAASCVGGLSLDPLTAVYLASGKGPAMNNIQMQQAIFRDNSAPMPIQFINAVSNAVSFYVMQEHSLQGQNLFVSREVHAFEAALTLAAIDMHTGRVPAALVGMVDELTHPLQDQCRRLGVAPDTALGEGSHWLLLTPQPAADVQASIECCQLFDDVGHLLKWLAKVPVAKSVAVFFGNGVDDALRSRCLNRLKNAATWQPQRENLWDGVNAGAIVRYVDAPTSEVAGQLLTISRDDDNRCQVTLLRRMGSNEQVK